MCIRDRYMMRYRRKKLVNSTRHLGSSTHKSNEVNETSQISCLLKPPYYKVASSERTKRGGKTFVYTPIKGEMTNIILYYLLHFFYNCNNNNNKKKNYNK